MFRLKILNLLFLFLLWFPDLNAQHNCNFYLPLNYTFSYSADPDISAVSNEMITVIAEDAVKSRRKVTFTLNALLHFHTETSPGTNPVLTITMERPRLSGNILFRKFSMAAVMMPGLVSFGCRIGKNDSVTLFESETIDRKFNGNDSILLQRQLPRFSCDSDTIVLPHLRFSLTSDDLEKFRSRVALINDYYASSAILDSLESEVAELNLGKLIDYPRYLIILEEINKILEIIRDRNFVTRLDLDSFDPEGFREKFNRLQRFSLSSTMTFRENLKTPGIPVFTFSEDTLIREFLDRMCRYIRWSMLVSERNSGIYREFLDRYYRMHAFGDDREVIRDLVVLHFPGRNPDSAIALIAGKINKAYHERAGEMMRNFQYAEAVELLENARSFCKINPTLKETDDREIFAKASNGIYNSYLGIAEGALQNERPEMARSYMVRAQAYRKEHAAYVTEDSLFNTVFAAVVADNLSRCDTLFRDSLYPQALECYQEFEKGFDSLTISSIHRVLKPKMDYCRYRILISEGERNLALADKPEAGRYFFLARQLSLEAKLPPDTLLDFLCRVIYPFYLIHLLRTEEGLIWENRLENARSFVDSIAFLQRTTGVESSRDLSDELATYRRKVEDRICWNATEKVEIFLLQAQRKREMKNFLVAGQLSDSAISVASQYSDCDIRLPGINDTTSKYHEAWEFQRLLKQVEIFTDSGRYKDAVNTCNELENYNRLHDVGRFGISIPTMFDLITNRSISELTLQALLYFREKKDPVMAFRYVKMIRLQGYPRKSAGEQLEWLGRELAGKDFADRPDQDPVSLVRNYAGRDPWMKRFRIAYYNNARHLRHKPFFEWQFRKFFP